MRAGLHWTGILALAGAFGVLQAGVVDQSLFATSYLGYDGWDDPADAHVRRAARVSAPRPR